jgi:hypothetical protein
MSKEIKKIRLTTQSQSVAITVSVESLDVENNLRAFRIVYKADAPVAPYLAGLIKEKTVEGLAKPKDIAAFEKGTAASIPTIPCTYVASDQFLDSVRHLGYNQAVEEQRKRDTQGGPESLRADVYTAIVDKGMPIGNLIIADWGSHMLFKIDGTVLPVGIHCDYISAGMDNKTYDLKKLVEILRDDPRITFKKGSQVPFPEILDIPYYNAGSGRNQCVEFVYAPTPEEAILLWDKMNSYGQKYPSTYRHRAMHDLDVLGLVRAGIRKPPVEEVEEAEED